jgi:hypothetical protein
MMSRAVRARLTTQSASAAEPAEAEGGTHHDPSASPPTRPLRGVGYAADGPKGHHQTPSVELEAVGGVADS